MDYLDDSVSYKRAMERQTLKLLITLLINKDKYFTVYEKYKHKFISQWFEAPSYDDLLINLDMYVIGDPELPLRFINEVAYMFNISL